MFTVKFYRNNHQVSISCPVYEVQTFDGGGYAIIVHKSPVLGSGVEYRVEPIVDGHTKNIYSHCFVENELGKTIDSFRADGLKAVLG